MFQPCESNSPPPIPDQLTVCYLFLITLSILQAESLSPCTYLADKVKLRDDSLMPETQVMLKMVQRMCCDYLDGAVYLATRGATSGRLVSKSEEGG